MKKLLAMILFGGIMLCMTACAVRLGGFGSRDDYDYEYDYTTTPYGYSDYGYSNNGNSDYGYSGGTTSQNQALQKARSYLNAMAFSYEGLIDQLEYEGFSHSDAVYAADRCGANWKDQALQKAKSYLRSSAYLIKA